MKWQVSDGPMTGAAIRSIRLQAGMNLREASKAAGITAVRLGEIERDKRFMDLREERLLLMRWLSHLGNVRREQEATRAFMLRRHGEHLMAIPVKK